MKNAVCWDITQLRIVRIDVSEERIASIIKVTRISEIVFLRSMLRFVDSANVVPI
jgi:hypothetical protein